LLIQFEGQSAGEACSERLQVAFAVLSGAGANLWRSIVIRSLFIGAAALALTAGAAFAQDDYRGDDRGGPHYGDQGDYRTPPPPDRYREDYRDAPYHRDYRDRDGYRGDRYDRDSPPYREGYYYRDRPYFDDEAPAAHALAGGAAGAGIGAAIGCIVTIPIGCAPGAAIGAAVGGGTGAVAGAATTPPRRYYRPPDD
jgi:hypothetical protein